MKLVLAGAFMMLSIALAGCGGGGDGGGGGGSGGGTAGSASVSGTYTAAASIGDLVSFSIDQTQLTYAYTIQESQFGLQGRTGNGTLTRNSDGTYSLSGVPGAYVAALPNGLLLGAIRESVAGTQRNIPIVGVRSPVNTIGDMAGLYNYVSRTCGIAGCPNEEDSSHGTFSIDANGTWTNCDGGNLAAGPCASPESGTLNALGNGQWQVLHLGTVVGTALVFRSSNGQNVIVMDVKDPRAGGFGRGLLVGSTQQSGSANDANGLWLGANTNDDWFTLRVSGQSVSYVTWNGEADGDATTLTYNSPWTGAASTPLGTAILAGTGVYVYDQSNSTYAEFGIKIQ